MKHYEEQMPLYVAGQLDPSEISALEAHLAECRDCRAELQFWRSLSTHIVATDAAVSAPADLARRALIRIQAEQKSGFWINFLKSFSLLRAQTYLIKREMWPTSAAIMALGVIVALLSKHVEAISFIAPLLAAGLTTLYGRDQDPGYELAAATPTSAWKILLARLSAVSAYNLLLALLASLALLPLIAPNLLGMFILGWLAPMAFLSALALLLSLWIGANTATALAYTLWMLQYLQFSKIFESWASTTAWETLLATYWTFWQSPGLMLILAAAILGVALLWTHYMERSLPQYPA